MSVSVHSIPTARIFPFRCQFREVTCLHTQGLQLLFFIVYCRGKLLCFSLYERRDSFATLVCVETAEQWSAYSAAGCIVADISYLTGCKGSLQICCELAFICQQSLTGNLRNKLHCCAAKILEMSSERLLTQPEGIQIWLWSVGNGPPLHVTSTFFHRSIPNEED